MRWLIIMLYESKRGIQFSSVKPGYKDERGKPLDYLLRIYNLCEPQMTWPPKLLFNVLVYGPRVPDSIPKFFSVFFFFFNDFNAELLHNCKMEF